MQIIPVIDLKDGHVVHAKRGQRDRYRPLNTPLCPTSKPLDVIEAFLSLYPFKVCYLADLNAITGNGNNAGLIHGLLATYPQIEFWTDAGYHRDFFVVDYLPNQVPVLGSESLKASDLDELQDHRTSGYILSLDFSADGPLGPQALFSNPSYWPENVIIMPLKKVGSHDGPDFRQMTRYCLLAPETNFIAAAGARHLDDLLELQKIGIRHTLIATSLHEKKNHGPGNPISA